MSIALDGGAAAAGSLVLVSLAMSRYTDDDMFYIKVGRALTSGFPEVALRQLHGREHPDHTWASCPEKDRWDAVARQVSDWASREVFPDSPFSGFRG